MAASGVWRGKAIHTPILAKTDEHRLAFRSFSETRLTQTAAVQTLMTIPTASFELPAEGLQDRII